MPHHPREGAHDDAGATGNVQDRILRASAAEGDHQAQRLLVLDGRRRRERRRLPRELVEDERLVIARRYHAVRLWSTPPFMITEIRSCIWKRRRFLSGSPSTTSRSAYLPGSTVPILSDMRNSSAFTLVAERSTSIGFITCAFSSNSAARCTIMSPRRSEPEPILQPAL